MRTSDDVAVWMRTVKVGFRGFVQPLAVGLARAGIQANWLTYAGFLLNVVVAYVVAQGWLGIAGAAFLLVNALDFLDGAVARAAGTAGAFGAFLDSVLDRYSEAVVFVGLIVWYARADDTFGVVVSALALAGSFMVSYCRARAEGLGLDCEVGLLQRPERIVVLGIGLMLAEITYPVVLLGVLIVLAVMTNVTALQRMRHVAKLFEERAGRR
jgi:CDP-diacylglycerol--glycerol-3-phosphate 3-phosphatidyltransferase